MKTCLFILFFGLMGVGVRAQTISSPPMNTSEVYWNVPLPAEQKVQAVLVNSQTNIPDPASLSSTINLNQNGLNNHATAQTLSGSQNRLDINQFGSANAADAVLSGTNNSLILNQTGSGNVANLGLNGTNNRFLISQDGGDVVNMQGLQKDNTRLELSQGRGNNSFTLDNTSIFTDPLGKGVPNLRIEQTGGSAITIQQGRVN